MTNQKQKITTQKPNELLEIQKQDLKVNVLPPNYMEKLKASVAGLTAELNKPGMRESLIRDINKRQEEKSKLEKNSESLKELEIKRKNKALAELGRLGMKTEENINKINAIKFEEDGILIGDVKRAYENMKGGDGNYKEFTNEWYYGMEQRINEARQQGLQLPTEDDFINTLNALPGKLILGKFDNAYKGGNILAIILGEKNHGTCAEDGGFYDADIIGRNGYLGSMSRKDSPCYFRFTRSSGELGFGNRTDKLVCRPIIKNTNKK